MFNGIIKKTGKLHKVIKKGNNCIFKIKSSMKFTKNEIGSSVCCSGACLTLSKINKNIVEFYVSKETLRRSAFKFSKIGDVINLEKSLKFGQRVSGHFVQGHVDTTAIIKKINLIGKSWEIDFNIPLTYKKYLVTKGSITINGVSLTIAKLLKNGFKIAVIPKSLHLTNLKNLKKNNLVNVEIDILSKYIKKFIN